MYKAIVKRYSSVTTFLSIIFCAVIGTTACVLHHTGADVSKPLQLPPAYEGGTLTGSVVEQWWDEFDDPGLSDLMNAVLSQNLDMQRSWARLEQTRILARQAGSAWWPQITADGGASRARTTIPVTPPGTGNVPKRVTTYSMGVAASYEIDLWGRIASLDRAARREVQASRMDLEAIAMSLTGEVAETWFSLIEQQEQLDLAQAQLDTNRTYLELVEFRFGQGLASSVDVFQQRQQTAAGRARIPLIESRIGVLMHALNLLTGRYPGQGIAPIPASLPSLWPQPATGIPAALLTRRPDVQAAQFRVKAADERVGAAIVDRFPALRLSASTGYSADSLSDLVDNWIWSIAGSVTASVWDGHRKNLEVERTRSVLDEQVALYGRVVLTALKEVEDALIQEEKQRLYVEKLDMQIALARATLDESRQRYLNGLSDYLPVLVALQSLQQTESTLLSAKKKLVSFRIQLCRALGGTWTSNLEKPERGNRQSGDEA